MNRFYSALEQHYISKITEAVATLDLYFNKSVGIGEHSDILEEIKNIQICWMMLILNCQHLEIILIVMAH